MRVIGDIETGITVDMFLQCFYKWNCRVKEYTYF